MWMGEGSDWMSGQSEYTLCRGVSSAAAQVGFFFFFFAVHEAGVTNLTQSPIGKVNIFLPVLQIEELSQDMVNVFVKVI